MGLFSSKKTKENSELNAFLGVGTEYKGKLDFVGTVRIDGRFEGEITTEGVLILGRKASIVGVVRVGQLNSCGEILGDVHVKEKAVFEKTSVLKGSLDTPVLVVEKGALVEGTICMTMGAAVETKPKVVSANFGGGAVKPVARELEVAKTGSDNNGA
ncbi:polymer-forming cytoskeletal protein [Desulfovibrio sp. Huiquan2017]|uniref:bactofilin family protein n=1 Tax=Desulfovibrio sp. Huiquan2017 TaxID=2816861 RepID=UPI001A91499A|nr:polymer-forming cytoskeletal protein [Desulfovibrio sp. Huiquan2017]